MIVLVQASVLTIDISEKEKVLRQLPIELIKMRSCSEAARYLKNEEVKSIISKWDYGDLEKARFLRSLKSIKPHISTVVLIEPGSPELEIAARSFGASAVLSEDIDDEHFLLTMTAILGLRNIVLNNVKASAELKDTTTQKS